MLLAYWYVYSTEKVCVQVRSKICANAILNNVITLRIRSATRIISWNMCTPRLQRLEDGSVRKSWSRRGYFIGYVEHIKNLYIYIKINLNERGKENYADRSGRPRELNFLRDKRFIDSMAATFLRRARIQIRREVGRSLPRKLTPTEIAQRCARSINSDA